MYPLSCRTVIISLDRKNNLLYLVTVACIPNEKVSSPAQGGRVSKAELAQAALVVVTGARVVVVRHMAIENAVDRQPQTFVMLACPGVGGRCESDSETRPLGSCGARSVASLPMSVSNRLRPCAYACSRTAHFQILLHLTCRQYAVNHAEPWQWRQVITRMLAVQ